MLLNKLLTFKRSRATQDAQATTVENWTTAQTVASNVPVSIQQMSSRDSYEFNRRGFDVDFSIFAQSSPALRQGDRAADPDGDGYFEVRGFPDDMAGRGRMFEILAKKLR